MNMQKEYLGDSVYARSDGYGIILTTENGFEASNMIYLEPEVWLALLAFVEKRSTKKSEYASKTQQTS